MCLVVGNGDYPTQSKTVKKAAMSLFPVISQCYSVSDLAPTKFHRARAIRASATTLNTQRRPLSFRNVETRNIVEQRAIKTPPKRNLRFFPLCMAEVYHAMAMLLHTAGL